MNRTIAIVLGLLALVGLSACSRTDGDKLPRQERLSKQDYNAAMAEARRRYRREDPPGQPWEFLDRDKLRRLLDMPEFADSPSNMKAPLIDQAGAWELMSFDRPSQALAMWSRWVPENRVDTPVKEGDRDAPRLDVYYADSKWGKEAGAQIALLSCMPGAAWRVRHMEPMVWAMENEGKWGIFDGENFAQCVRRQSEKGPFAAKVETARGRASAAILERKLSSYLLAHSCTGKGPDSCLHLVHGLVALNRRHEKLPAIFKLVEPDLLPDKKITLPDTEHGRKTIELARSEALRRLLYLSAKVTAVQANEKAWPGGELDRSLAATLENDLLMVRAARQLEGGSYDLRDQAVARPWMALPPAAAQPAALRETLQRLGREAASTPGCDDAAYNLANMPEPFWMGYAIAKLEREQSSCHALSDRSAAVRLYAHAGKPGALEQIAGLRHFLDTEGPARREVLSVLGAACRRGQADPWQVCAATR